MKANELRIGNYIEFYNHIEPKITVKVNARFFSSLAGGRSMDDVKDDEELNGYYSGIPLTPEIFEKCGIQRERIGWVLSYDFKIYDPLELGGIGFYVQAERKIYTILHKEKTFPIGFKYLHQLQNLYFALTGEELPVNLA